MFKRSGSANLTALLKKAESFHGHLGPFLVIGVRMGLAGLRELKARRNERGLHITVMLKYSVPFSCIIDGIQVATNCTIGNKKLMLKKSSKLMAKFRLENGRPITVKVNPVAFNRLKDKLLAKNIPSKEVRNLAKTIASMPEEELFEIN
jgi:formylmethanofuran dehydrogenase subunit E